MKLNMASFLNKFSKTDLFFYSLMLGLVMFFVWYYRFLPLQDYPDWLYQGFVFSQILKGHHLGSFQIIHYPIPNAVCTVFIGFLNLFVNPEVSGKLFLTFDIVLFIASSIYLINALNPKEDSVFSYLPFILLFNTTFFHGFLNYTFSLGMLFIGMGYILRRHERPDNINIFAIIIISLLLFFSHAISYFAWLLFVFIFVLFNFRKKTVTKFSFGILPSIMLMAIYTLNRMVVNKDVKVQYFAAENILEFLRLKANVIIKFISIFHHFYPLNHIANNYTLIFQTLNLLFYYLVFFIVSYWFIRFLVKRDMYMPLVVTAIAFIFVFIFGPDYFGDMIKPHERFIYPALWSITACLTPTVHAKISKKKMHALRIGIASAVVLQFALTFLQVVPICKEMSSQYTNLQTNTGSQSFYTIDESHFSFGHAYKQKYNYPLFLPVHAPLYRLSYYIHIKQHTYTEIFPTGILLDKTRKKLDSTWNVSHLVLKPQYIVTIGSGQGNNFISNLLKHKYQIISRNKYTIILKRK